MSLLGPLWDLAVASGLAALCTAVGLRVLSPLNLWPEDPLERLPLALATGSGILATALLGLGFAGRLEPAPLLLLLGGAALTARGPLRGLPGELAGAVGRVRRGAGGWWPALVVFHALLLVFLATQGLLPVGDWDSQMYHLRVPSQFLDQGRIFLPADNFHTAFIGLCQMLYVPLLAFAGPAATTLFGLGLAVGLAAAVHGAADRLFGGRAAALASLLLWGTTSLLLVAVTPRVDVGLALFVFLGHLALLLALEEDPRFAWLAAGLLGFGVGVKYQALLYLGALAPVLIVFALGRGDAAPGGFPGAPERGGGQGRWRFRGWGTVRPLAAFGALAAVVAAPWLLKNQVLLGAPLHPFLAVPEMEPWLAALAGSATPPESVPAGFHWAIRETEGTFNLRDAFLAPGRLSVEGEARFYFTNPAFLLLPLALLSVRQRRMWTILLPAVAYLLLVFLPLGSASLRYAIPAVPALTIAVAATAIRWTDRLPSRRASTLVLAAVTAVALLPTAGTVLRWMEWRPPLPYLTGRDGAEEYLATSETVGPSADFVNTVRFANRTVGPEGRILMIMEARGYYFDVPVTQDNRLMNWAYLSRTDAAERCLEGTGISHVLVNNEAAVYYARRGTDLGRLNWGALQGWADRCLTLAHREGAYLLFRVRDGADARAAAREGGMEGGPRG